MFPGFSGHGNSINNIIPQLKKENVDWWNSSWKIFKKKKKKECSSEFTQNKATVNRVFFRNNLAIILNFDLSFLFFNSCSFYVINSMNIISHETHKGTMNCFISLFYTTTCSIYQFERDKKRRLCENRNATFNNSSKHLKKVDQYHSNYGGELSVTVIVGYRNGIGHMRLSASQFRLVPLEKAWTSYGGGGEQM